FSKHYCSPIHTCMSFVAEMISETVIATLSSIELGVGCISTVPPRDRIAPNLCLAFVGRRRGILFCQGTTPQEDASEQNAHEMVVRKWANSIHRTPVQCQASVSIM